MQQYRVVDVPLETGRLRCGGVRIDSNNVLAAGGDCRSWATERLVSHRGHPASRMCPVCNAVEGFDFFAENKQSVPSLSRRGAAKVANLIEVSQGCKACAHQRFYVLLRACSVR
jgi:hypothetical protein